METMCIASEDYDEIGKSIQPKDIAKILVTFTSEKASIVIYKPKHIVLDLLWKSKRGAIHTTAASVLFLTNIYLWKTDLPMYIDDLLT